MLATYSFVASKMSSKPKLCDTCGADFKNVSQQSFWERYKVLDLERPMHGDQLLACVLDFYACNM